MGSEKRRLADRVPSIQTLIFRMSNPQAPPSPPLMMGILARYDSEKGILSHQSVQLYRSLQEDHTKWRALPVSAQAGLPLKQAPMSSHIGQYPTESSALSAFPGKDLEALYFFDLAFDSEHEELHLKTGVIIARCDGEDLLQIHFDLYCSFLFRRCFALRVGPSSVPENDWRQHAAFLKREYLTPTEFFKYFQEVRGTMIALGHDIYNTLPYPVKLPPPVPICGNCFVSTELTTVVCQRCLITAYCGQACMSMDCEKHKEICGKLNLTAKIPCVYVQIGWTPDREIGRQDTWMDCTKYTPSSYPGHLLVHSNVAESKASAILGTPLWIVESPINVPAEPYATVEQKRVYKTATLLTMETDLQKPNFSWPTKRVFSDIAIVRRDGRELDWRLVEYMVSWLWDVHQKVYNHFTVVKGVPSDQTAYQMLNPGMFRAMFDPWQENMKKQGNHRPELYEPIDPEKFW